MFRDRLYTSLGERDYNEFVILRDNYDRTLELLEDMNAIQTLNCHDGRTIDETLGVSNITNSLVRSLNAFTANISTASKFQRPVIDLVGQVLGVISLGSEAPHLEIYQ